MSVRFGLGLFTGQVPPGSARTIADEYADLLMLARLAESTGYDSLWVSEHHSSADGHLPSLMVMLAAVAAVTERLTLGTAVALAPFQHPLRFAEDCAVVDQLSRGRLLVGLGIGWRKREFDAFGVPTNERVGRTSELVRICRAAWDEERFSFDGRHFRYSDVAVTPKPYHRIPILLGGTVPGAAARAGRIADGFIATPKNDIAAFRDQIAIFDDAVRLSGRDPRRMPIGFHVDAWVSEDGRLSEHALRGMQHMLATYALWREQNAGSTSAALPTVDESVLRARSIVGTSADVIEQTRPWIEEFGHRELHVVMRLHYPGMTAKDTVPAVLRLAGEVLPGLRAVARAREHLAQPGVR